ncbi:MAG: hypothetical protein D3910_12465, partial [Candidatus Electrothrix sp. ATG2]|nr:hypothetical protein [Candidatus Electrothrix sp. ATG2]
GKRKGRKKRILAVLVLLVLVGGVFWFLSTRQDTVKGTFLEPIAEKMPNLSGRVETQVIIMMNGDTYYAEKVEKDGAIVRITTKNGAVVEVAEKNVLDITTAVIED